MKDTERMGAREWRDEAISSPRRVSKALRRRMQAVMAEGDAGPYAEAESRVEVGAEAASIAEMVVDLVDTAERYGRDWRPTLAEFIQLRLQRFAHPPSNSEE